MKGPGLKGNIVYAYGIMKEILEAKAAKRTDKSLVRAYAYPPLQL